MFPILLQLGVGWWLFSWFSWFLLSSLKLVVWALVAGLFGLWWSQGSFLYMPSFQGREQEKRLTSYNPSGLRTPEEQGLPFSSHYVETKDSEKIHVWFLPQPQQSTAPTLIFFHGNAGNIGFRLPNAKTLYHYTKVNILMVEYRGYGNSTGSPSETGLLMDADAALRFLREDTKVDQKQIFVFGRSLGGAVAITLCYHRQKFLRGLIVENTFTGIDEMAVLILARLGVRRGHTLAKAFLYFFLTNRWPNLDLIRKIKIPILFISGLADELIPPSHMQRLHDAATESVGKRFYGVPNGEHNDTYIQGAATYYMQLSSFIQSILANTVNDHNVPAVN